MYRLRYRGKEYGPFTREQLIQLVRGRPFRKNIEEDAIFDPKAGTWVAIPFWLSAQSDLKKVQGDFLTNLTVHSAYRRIITAGAAVFLLWGSVFLGVKARTGKWPGEGAPQHRNRFFSEMVDTSIPG